MMFCFYIWSTMRTRYIGYRQNTYNRSKIDRTTQWKWQVLHFWFLFIPQAHLRNAGTARWPKSGTVQAAAVEPMIPHLWKRHIAERLLIHTGHNTVKTHTKWLTPRTCTIDQTIRWSSWGLPHKIKEDAWKLVQSVYAVVVYKYLICMWIYNIYQRQYIYGYIMYISIYVIYIYK
jgi:hypothetical protein